MPHHILSASKKCLHIWFVSLSPSQTDRNKDSQVRAPRLTPSTINQHISAAGPSEFPRDTRHKLQLNINPVSGRMQTACLKILTRLINFKTNFVTLLLRKFVARADGESGPTERGGSDRQTTQHRLPLLIHEMSACST